MTGAPLQALMRYRHAPGHYQVRCGTCDGLFFGDKDARRCRPCAEAAFAEDQQIEQLHHEQMDPKR